MKQFQAKLASALIVLILIGSMFAIGIEAMQSSSQTADGTMTTTVIAQITQ